MEIPEENIDISRLSIYAGRTGGTVTAFEKNVPSLYMGTWKDNNGNLAIAIASISNEIIPVNLTIDPENYNISKEGQIYIIKSDGKKLLKNYSDNIHIDLKLDPRYVGIIEIIPK